MEEYKMTINVRAKGFDLVPGTHEAINAELSDLNKILGVDASYNVSIKKRVYGEYECMISTYIEPRDYNIKATRKSIRSAIEAAAKAMKEMILEERSKFITKKLNAAVDNWDTVETEDKAPRKVSVTKKKDVFLTPISDAEAINELNASDKDMYMYLDEETLEVKGVYHRADGYGVITFKTT